MDEFGQSHSIYIWPMDHEDGQPFPEDFFEVLAKVLDANGFEWEHV